MSERKGFTRLSSGFGDDGGGEGRRKEPRRHDDAGLPPILLTTPPASPPPHPHHSTPRSMLKVWEWWQCPGKAWSSWCKRTKTLLS